MRACLIRTKLLSTLPPGILPPKPHPTLSAQALHSPRDADYQIRTKPLAHTLSAQVHADGRSACRAVDGCGDARCGQRLLDVGDGCREDIHAAAEEKRRKKKEKAARQKVSKAAAAAAAAAAAEGEGEGEGH